MAKGEEVANSKDFEAKVASAADGSFIDGLIQQSAANFAHADK